ncbi:hypothetical protein K440DRAFT_656880 [Wilcoxina mikolae CBS 423.85]|nr:hypothetical protein K440DRAFT_656880 [Wilcoxina mikolae CBS 423.85]
MGVPAPNVDGSSVTQSPVITAQALDILSNRWGERRFLIQQYVMKTEPRFRDNPKGLETNPERRCILSAMRLAYRTSSKSEIVIQIIGLDSTRYTEARNTNAVVMQPWTEEEYSRRVVFKKAPDPTPVQTAEAYWFRHSPNRLRSSVAPVSRFQQTAGIGTLVTGK